MLCNKCNHKLPDDSEFCQYCGNRLEKFNENTASQMPDVEGVPSGDALKSVFEVYAQETVKAMKANSENQTNYESDPDFGLVPEKPIYTLAVKSVNGEAEYLNKLYTVSGEKIKWNRRGSMGVKGIHGMIDIYDTYLPSGQPYKTIYINMYGAKTSTKVPMGFTACQNGVPNCITYPNSAKRIEPQSSRLNSVASVLSIILSAIAILFVVIAMNFQDIARNTKEATNPTLLYAILIGIYAVSIVLFLLSQKERFPIAQHLFAFAPSVFAIATLIEGSLFSNSYFSYPYHLAYENKDLVSVFNTLWVIASFVILILNLMPLKTNAQAKWRASMRYRENCYRRVEKMKGYLDNGIITEEEFEKNKQDLLKNIKM